MLYNKSRERGYPIGMMRDIKANERTITVGVLDANDLLREGLMSLLRQSDGFVPGGDWRDAASCLRDLRESLPDVLLVDMKLPGQSAFKVLEALPSISPRTKTLVTVDCRSDDCVVLNPKRFGDKDPMRVIPQPFSAPDDCLQIALKMGAHGVLHNHCSFDYLAKAIRAVHGGQYWMELPTANRLAEQYLLSMRPTNTPVSNASEKLTLRERQVATLVAQGRSNKEIAHELQLGYSTVKNYVSSILEKLDLRDRTQIALYAVDQEPEDAIAGS